MSKRVNVLKTAQFSGMPTPGENVKNGVCIGVVRSFYLKLSKTLVGGG